MALSDITIGDAYWQETNLFPWALGRTKSTRAALLEVDAGPQGLSERLITWHLRESHSTRSRALQSAAELAFIAEESAEETSASIIAAGDDVLAQR